MPQVTSRQQDTHSAARVQAEAFHMQNHFPWLRWKWCPLRGVRTPSSLHQALRKSSAVIPVAFALKLQKGFRVEVSALLSYVSQVCHIMFFSGILIVITRF